MTDNNNLSKIISRIGDLPVMPSVVAQVMELTGNPDVALSEVSRPIERDPALTAKILKISNSAYYGMRHVVGTLKLALVILGVREVRNIVIGVSVLDALRDRNTEILLNHYGLWAHSAQVASLSKKLGAHLRESFQGEDFIAGLLHDLGKMVLWRQLGEEYRTLFRSAQASGAPLYQLERARLGFDHADVIAALAGAWNLPDTLQAALLNNHDGPGRNPKTCRAPRLAALVRIANAASHDRWNDHPANELVSCTEPVWEILEDPGAEHTPATRYEILSQFMQSVDQAPALVL